MQRAVYILTWGELPRCKQATKRCTCSSSSSSCLRQTLFRKLHFHRIAQLKPCKRTSVRPRSPLDSACPALLSGLAALPSIFRECQSRVAMDTTTAVQQNASLTKRKKNPFPSSVCGLPKNASLSASPPASVGLCNFLSESLPARLHN